MSSFSTAWLLPKSTIAYPPVKSDRILLSGIKRSPLSCLKCINIYFL
ncbi:MAG: hypothetical protein RMY28_023245 [Nostoc sp. ChiSLP01]|nr:hypothetical protein [Nostoc sp. CmiSLP01]MDZ8288538.1 hypothetical protein [Nostoc sp. ChiSLP01]